MKAENKKLRVVFDTNVILSMLAFPGGRLDVLWEIVQGDILDIYLSEFIVEELVRNLERKIKLDPRLVAELIAVLKGHTHMIVPVKTIDVIQEKDSDNRILECAVEADADVLVTGNFKHIRPLGKYRGILILTPREFLDQYFPYV